MPSIMKANEVCLVRLAEALRSAFAFRFGISTDPQGSTLVNH